MKTVTVLGSTGSVGVNTLKVLEGLPDLFRVKGLAAATRADGLCRQAQRWKPDAVYLDDPGALEASNGSGLPPGTQVFGRSQGLRAFAAAADADILVAATSGTSALGAVLDAIGRGRRVALANKEILVVAGSAVMEALSRRPDAALVPVDSEHSAIFQCLRGEKRSAVRRLILTGTGGPLREVARERFAGLTKEFVTNHPRWKMGQKISVDSATMMNKGLEIIEAAWLFAMPVDRIDVLVHPEAVVHSMVEFTDGSVLAQMGVTDMRLPILYALGHPDRLQAPDDLRLDWSAVPRLNFEAPDRKKFPCLDLAYRAARASGSAPCVLSAADEVAVKEFLEERIDFARIPAIIENVLSRHRHVERPDLGQIETAYAWAVEEAQKCCRVS